MPVNKYAGKSKSTGTGSKLKKPDVCFCTRCGKMWKASEQRRHFATAKSPLWEKNSNRLPVCNDCLRFYYDFYLTALGDAHSAYRRMCMKFDLYYNDEIVDNILAKEQSADRVGLYITQLGYARYLNKTYDNTIEEDKGRYLQGDWIYETTDENGNSINIKAEYEKLKAEVEQDKAEKALDELEELPEYAAIFGEETGFKTKEQKAMVKYYNEQLEQMPAQLVTTLNETVKDLARFKILQARAIAHDDMKEITSYSNQFNNARKYIDSTVEKFKKNAMTEENSIVIGTMTELIENFSPASIYQSPEAFKDVDNLNNNVLHRMIRSAKNFFTGSRELDPQFRLPN